MRASRHARLDVVEPSNNLNLRAGIRYGPKAPFNLSDLHAELVVEMYLLETVCVAPRRLSCVVDWFWAPSQHQLLIVCLLVSLRHTSSRWAGVKADAMIGSDL